MHLKRENLLWILWLASIITTWSISKQVYSTGIPIWFSTSCSDKQTLKAEEQQDETAASSGRPSWLARNHGQSLLATQVMSVTDCIANVDDRAVLDEQVQVQEIFQRIIHDMQHPQVCHEARGYRYHRFDTNMVLDGFALEFQNLARHLQTALALHRTFEVPTRWKSAYAPPDCNWTTTGDEKHASRTISSDFLCLWKPPSSCTPFNMRGRRKEAPKYVDNPLPTGAGIVRTQSDFFDTSMYGPKRRVDWVHESVWPLMPPHVDVLHHWERTYGRFWVRAQMAHFLWHPSDGLQSEIDKRAPPNLVNGETKYIGMHIRKTDNMSSLKWDFGRDANITRSLSRFMDIAGQIKAENPEIGTIYLATDNSKIVREARKISDGNWKFVIQRDVERSTTTDWIWFKESRAFGAAAIATDLEVLRRADFLIGSHQSNVYRLATELNTAWNVAKYPQRLNRLRTVDIPWYEDP